MMGRSTACASVKSREKTPRGKWPRSCAAAKASARWFSGWMRRLPPEERNDERRLPFLQNRPQGDSGEIGARGWRCFRVEDINPQAPTHILICPRRHFESLNEATTEDQAALGKMQMIAAKLARERNLLGGYRTVVNTGRGAGQTVFHLHLHLLGGRAFHWPPG